MALSRSNPGKTCRCSKSKTLLKWINPPKGKMGSLVSCAW